MTTIKSNLDIRDIEMGATYWVVIDGNRGNRACNSEGNPMFRAAFPTKTEAVAAAKLAGPGFRAVPTIKD